MSQSVGSLGSSGGLVTQLDLSKSVIRELFEVFVNASEGKCFREQAVGGSI